MRSSLPLFFSFSLYFSLVFAFSVTISSSPTQCGPLNVAWSGGQPPFEITLIPVFDIPRNVSVPTSAFSNNQGFYQIPSLPFNKSSSFLLTMSDATGFGTGGTSELLTVGAPAVGASCNTSNPSLPYSFGLPSSLQQCNPYIFNGYDAATLPVTITGFIPGGNSFLLYTSQTSYSWVADVAAGTTIIFTMTDAQGRTGGSSDTETVADSNDASCLDVTSPSSTVSASPSSTSGASSATSSPTHSPSRASTGTIIGAAFGGLLAVSAIIALAVFCIKQRRYRSYGFPAALNSRRRNSVDLDPDIQTQPAQIYPFPYQADSVSPLAPTTIPSSSAIPTPYQDSPSMGPSDQTSERPYTQYSRTASHTGSLAAYGDVGSSSMSSGQRKAAMAGVANHQPATRFIVHTDAEDYVPSGEAEVVELPPQYSERGPSTTRTEERPMSTATALSSDLPYTSRQDTNDLRQYTLRPPLQ